MKKLTLLIIALLVSTLVFPQNDSLLIKTINTTNYCLYKFQKEKSIAHTVEIVGLLSVVYANSDHLNGTKKATQNYQWDIAAAGTSITKINEATKNYNDNIDHINERCEVITYIGVGLIIGGGILNIASYRWLKRAYVIPIDNGVAVGVKFNF